MSSGTDAQSGRGAPEPKSVRVAAAALVGLVVVTVAWWGLALWPVPDVPPAWLLRTRQVCFNAGPTGLPDASGWMLLIGQPIGMFAVLMVVAGDAVRAVFADLRSSMSGRLVLGSTLGLLLLGGVWAGVRVNEALADSGDFVFASDAVPTTYPRVDLEPPPPLGLVDQHGEGVQWGRFAEKRALVTFAFGHCATVCPLVVMNARRARDEMQADDDIPVVVVTLDPWRDTPSRLPHLAEQWELAEGDVVASGSIEDVNRFLDELEIPRQRDEKTGDVVHPSLVYVLGTDGRFAYATTGHTDLIKALLERTS